MIRTKKVRISIDEYEITNDAIMGGGGHHLGSINQCTGEIKMREINFDNSKMTKRMYFKVLMHEIAHGIDFNVMFVGEERTVTIEYAEDVIDLVSIYMIKYLPELLEKKGSMFDHYVEYATLCEYKIRRHQLTFTAIIDFIMDNPLLIEEFIEVFHS